MRYAVTLKPAGAIPRDPALTVRLTRTRDVAGATRIVTPKPPAVHYPYIDSFYDPSGTLRDHVANSGHMYVSISHGRLAGTVLDGRLRLALNDDEITAAIDPPPPTADYYAEIVVAVAGFSTPNLGMFGLRVRSGGDSGDYYAVTGYPLPWASDGLYYIIAKNVGGAYTYLNGGLPVTSSATITDGVPFTVRVEMVGTTLTLITNGATEYTEMDGDISQIGTVELQIGTGPDSGDENRIYILRAEVDSL